VYTYDPNGNLSRKGDTLYTWDARNRLVAATTADTQSSFAYDSVTGRVKQAVRRSDGVTTTLYVGRYVEVRGDKLVLYVFDQDRRVAEVTTPFEPAGLLAGFEAQPAPTAGTGEKRWYVVDHLGSANLLLDEQGRILSEMAYYPFGLTRYQNNGKEIIYGFTGKELDASGLHYYGARYYDALTGRFISADPLYVENPIKNQANPQSLNVYAYALNSPLVYNDPTGYDAKSTVTHKVETKYDVIRAANSRALVQHWKSQGWAGLTRANHPTVDYKLDANGRIKQVTVDLKITVTLPQWIIPNDVGPKTRAEYERISKVVAKHEQDHVQIALRFADDMSKKLIGKTPNDVFGVTEQTWQKQTSAQFKFDKATKMSPASGEHAPKFFFQHDDAGMSNKGTKK
jgi:RHS repeat-associated protein